MAPKTADPGAAAPLARPPPLKSHLFEVYANIHCALSDILRSHNKVRSDAMAVIGWLRCPN